MGSRMGNCSCNQYVGSKSSLELEDMNLKTALLPARRMGWVMERRVVRGVVRVGVEEDIVVGRKDDSVYGVEGRR